MLFRVCLITSTYSDGMGIVSTTGTYIFEHEIRGVDA